MERQFLKLITIILIAFAIGCTKAENNQEASSEAAMVEPEETSNTLTTEEAAAGWELLFDGKSTDQWKGYNKSGFPEHG